MLNPGGYLAFADLYTEAGSFHASDMQVQKGFEPANLKKMLIAGGLHVIQYRHCFEIQRHKEHV